MESLDCRIVPTGQHYDHEMSQAFFGDLELPQPHFFLNAGSGSHATQTARIRVAFEKICDPEKPDLVIVVGDVNTTLACILVAKKMMIRVAHVEAGLRSFDLSMPEEINRIITVPISDYFFVTEKSAIENLNAENGRLYLFLKRRHKVITNSARIPPAVSMPTSTREAVRVGTRDW